MQTMMCLLVCQHNLKDTCEVILIVEKEQLEA